MHVGIIGGGMMGLATAFYLTQKGVQVTVLEKEKEIGGLSNSVEIIPGINWDRFYHVILSTDQVLLDFIDEIGLSLDVQFRETNTGFFTDGKLYSMSSTMEFLKFKPLSMLDKIRLGTGILYTSRINNWKRLEKLYVKTWLTRVFGRRNYEKMWEPLLRSKLGTASEQTSASFIWATIKRYYGTRHSSSKKEMLGCVKGGYHSILTQIQDSLVEQGVRIMLDHEVVKVERLTSRRSCLKTKNGNRFEFDRLVATVPNPIILRILQKIPDDYKQKLESVSYLSIICVVLLMKKQLTPFYVTNLTDDGFPFTGFIEASNVVSKETLDGKTLIYLPRYLPAGDPFYQKSDNEIIDLFMQAVKRIFPNLTEEDILKTSIHREPYVQPIQDIRYSEKIPSMQTPIENVYISNTTMILNSTLNNNEVIRLARKAADLVANHNLPRRME